MKLKAMNKVWILAAVVAVIAVGIQWIPAGVAQQVNVQPIQWDSPVTEQLANRACMACHGGSPPTPWYTKVAPVSWWTNRHVNEGRQKLDFATRHTIRFAEIKREIERGKMPLPSYTWLHPEAKLSTAEQQALIAGLQKTFAADAAPERSFSQEDDGWDD